MLNFNGRVTIASVKNFQVVHADDRKNPHAHTHTHTHTYTHTHTHTYTHIERERGREEK